MRAFAVIDGSYVAELDGHERAVIAAVVADVIELLGATRPELGALATRAVDPPGPDPLAQLRIRTQDVEPPADTAVRRLLPDASTQDPDVAAEFRRLTEDDLRTTKVAHLRALWDALVDGVGDGWPDGPLVVAPAAADGLAAALTDVRLVLADRLGLQDDEAAEALVDEVTAGDAAEGDVGEHVQVRRYLGAVFATVGWLQETLMDVLLDDLDRR